MKTILTTFAFIAFMTPVAFAGEAEEPNCGYVPSNSGDPSNAGKWTCHSQIDKLNETDQAGNERDIADSGNEGSTSAAQESDQ